MFGIGFEELVVILVLAFVVVGPERLPDLARRAGLFIRDLRRMYDNLRQDLGPEYDEVERAIQTLRSGDPRRQLDAYGRKVLAELAREAGPEAESLLQSSPGQLAESLKQSFALTPSDTHATEARTPSPLQPAATKLDSVTLGGPDGSFEDASTRSTGTPPGNAQARARRAKQYPVLLSQDLVPDSRVPG